VSADAPTGRFGKRVKLTILAAALAGAMVLPLSPARAQIYLGWDFGNGFGIGLGPPPSAYTPCPNYGWGPFYPFRCRYYAYRPWYGARRVVHHAHVKKAPHPAWTPPG
jgi:hypothetical protein